MATGIEIWHGFTYPEYHAAAPSDAPRLGWPLPPTGVPEGDGDAWRDLADPYFETFDAKLLAAWKSAVLELGWGEPKAKRGSRGYFNVVTPAGRRECSPFRLGMALYGEMGYDFPDVPIGVALSSRYFPTFLDYRDESGTLPAPLVVWTPEMAGMIDVAVRHIVSRVPWLGRGKTMVVEIHY